MARLNSNDFYLTIDGVDVHTYAKSVKLSRSNEDVDATAGPATHEQVQSGIDKTSWNIVLVYEVGSVAGIIAKIKPGAIVQADYGPEKAVTGKPRMTQMIKIGNVDGPEQAADKPLVTFQISAKGADAPSADLYAGATF